MLPRSSPRTGSPRWHRRWRGRSPPCSGRRRRGSSRPVRCPCQTRLRNPGLGSVLRSRRACRNPRPAGEGTCVRGLQADRFREIGERLFIVSGTFVNLAAHQVGGEAWVVRNRGIAIGDGAGEVFLIAVDPGPAAIGGRTFRAQLDGAVEAGYGLLVVLLAG